MTYEAKMKYTAEAIGSMGLLLRHTSDDAYIKVGYDFEAGEWFIDSCEGEDFVGYRLASCDATLTAGQWYEVKVVVDEASAELHVDDEKILSTGTLTQLTPGKIGVFAESVSAYVDDVSIYLNSGQGSIMKNVVHTKLPGDVYREGGTVVEMTDGSLMYVTHMSNDITFVSEDSGKTWTQRAEKWVDFATYPQVLRLNNGSLLQINRETIDGVSWHRAQISSDDGATWETAGYIRPREYNATEATANSGVTTAGSNANDKLTQMSDGRIFYCIGYDSTSAPMNGKSVFCEFFYSDDNGQTWTQSQTGSSFEIPGNENEAYFSECKTWGPIVKLEDFTCCTSSMQFVRDPYADNDTTYYMVWVQDDAGELVAEKIGLPRAHLSLAKTTDGVNWEILGDVWRWESRYKSIVQVVDPFIQVTEDYIIVGSGISEKVDSEKDTHNAQRQHIYSIDKSTLED